MQSSIQAFLRQRVDEAVTIEQASQQLMELAARCASGRGPAPTDATARPNTNLQRSSAKA